LQGKNQQTLEYAKSSTPGNFQTMENFPKLNFKSTEQGRILTAKAQINLSSSQIIPRQVVKSCVLITAPSVFKSIYPIVARSQRIVESRVLSAS